MNPNSSDHVPLYINELIPNLSALNSNLSLFSHFDSLKILFNLLPASENSIILSVFELIKDFTTSEPRYSKPLYERIIQSNKNSIKDFEDFSSIFSYLINLLSKAINEDLSEVIIGLDSNNNFALPEFPIKNLLQEKDKKNFVDKNLINFFPEKFLKEIKIQKSPNIFPISIKWDYSIERLESICCCLQKIPFYLDIGTYFSSLHEKGEFYQLSAIIARTKFSYIYYLYIINEDFSSICISDDISFKISNALNLIRDILIHNICPIFLLYLKVNKEKPNNAQIPNEIWDSIINFSLITDNENYNPDDFEEFQEEIQLNHKVIETIKETALGEKDWICEKCAVINSMPEFKCKKCNTINENIKDIIYTQYYFKNDVSNKSNEVWMCKFCKLHYKSIDKKCSKCKKSRDECAVVSRASKREVDNKTYLIECSYFFCTNCHIKNSSLSSKCTQCYTKRPKYYCEDCRLFSDNLICLKCKNYTTEVKYKY